MWWLRSLETPLSAATSVTLPSTRCCDVRAILEYIRYCDRDMEHWIGGSKIHRHCQAGGIACSCHSVSNVSQTATVPYEWCLEVGQPEPASCYYVSDIDQLSSSISFTGASGGVTPILFCPLRCSSGAAQWISHPLRMTIRLV